MARLVAVLSFLGLAVVLAGPASSGGAPVPGFALAARGVDGGTVWQGRIPNAELPSDRRPSAVYLPPGFTRDRSYPVLYVLHGMPGSPSSIWNGLHFADVADEAIAAGRAVPFIAVVPYGGPTIDQEYGEWAGTWERFVVQDVVPWADAELPTIPTQQGRAIGGLSAGGFGALDIALRHPTLFSTVEAWDGYFHPLLDGPFTNGARALLDGNDPTLLVAKDAPQLRAAGVRFFLSTGYGHGTVPESAAFDYGALLGRLGLRHEVWLLPRAELGHFWSAQLPAAIAYAESPPGPH